MTRVQLRAGCEVLCDGLAPPPLQVEEGFEIYSAVEGEIEETDFFYYCCIDPVGIWIGEGVGDSHCWPRHRRAF